jgi:hypothetical protein
VLENGGDYAGIGGLMATAMKYRGFAGAVVDASVRDTPQIRKLQFPVFSRGIAPSTTVNHYRVTGRQRAGHLRRRPGESWRHRDGATKTASWWCPWREPPTC